MIDAFNNISRASMPQKEGLAGQPNLDNLLALQIGYGSTTMKSNKNGLWLGAKNYASAPFYVDMNGNVVASSINLGGQYVATGGAAADINTYSTQIGGNKIVSLSITSTQIADNSISTPKLQANSVTANEIATNAVTAVKILANSIGADKIQAGAITADKISVTSLSAITGNLGTLTAGTINASLVSITNLSASSIVTGTLTVGGSGAPTAILLRQDNGLNNGNTYLRWEGGSRIWSDTSNRIGINSLGSPMYIYVGSSERIIIPSSGQTTIRGGVYSDGNFNATGDARVNGQMHFNYDNIGLSGQYFRLADMGLTSYRDGSGRGALRWGNGAEIRVDGSGKWFMINGNAKEAVVPTSDGYKALYCMESPEVWFMDFYKTSESEDPLFTEVTDGKRLFQTFTDEDGVEWFQVWRRRKGHANKRFESRTEERFNKNNEFWATPERESHDNAPTN